MGAEIESYFERINRVIDEYVCKTVVHLPVGNSRWCPFAAVPWYSQKLNFGSTNMKYKNIIVCREWCWLDRCRQWSDLQTTAARRIYSMRSDPSRPFTVDQLLLFVCCFNEMIIRMRPWKRTILSNEKWWIANYLLTTFVSNSTIATAGKSKKGNMTGKERKREWKVKTRKYVLHFKFHRKPQKTE